MATRNRPPPDDPPAAAGRDDRTDQALARSREIRKEGNRQLQVAWEHAAASRRGASIRSWALGRNPAAQLTDARGQIERSRQARANLAALTAKLAQTEDNAARIHDQLAGRDARHATQYRQAADDARQAARRAREIQRDATGPDPWFTA